MKSKFLVLYPDPAKLDAIIKKANVQHAKNGPFLAIVLLGCCLPAESPVTSPDAPTYFFGKSDEEGSFVDVSPNFTCVTSRNALLKLDSGVTLAFLNETLALANETDISIKADILFSYNWPYCIAADQRLTLVGDRAVDVVVRQLQPRYHFAAGSEMGKAHEHPVVAWSPKRSYRFVSLSREGTGSKWFYAFGIETGDDEVQMPSANPFLEDLKRPIEEENGGPATKQLRLDLRDGNDEPVKTRTKTVAPSECFFCLSNPRLESHMIVSIGKFSYLTVAKGPLTMPTRSLNFSGHAILIPIDHTPLLPDLKDVRQEIEQYMQSLADAFAKNGYDVAFYEISRPENVHFHIQMVPVPRGLIGKTFQRALDEKSRINNESFEHHSKLHFKKCLSEDPELQELENADRFIKFTIFSEKSKTMYITSLEEGKGLDLQFPRRVLAFLLRLPKRIKWDRCRQSMSQETIECQKFKLFYEGFDFTK
ncbi:hypothetical protein METBIDRAFT_33359 [Metschnikowia bicuspidata var. bicuspidata NRRL YB-4993]|uniref:Uncharacterized protein n=1 Tax=Metschnikowia bicuspidata var. bicuspidata NRRL YB-4993 TaxID=869754 RepID=A0A1A0H5H1_9ASCO|nr:hypothetical protein METBIDRAFT_33359 [Metschnikowia bicuspidata var. bicuspidata NRRL YB-4993]OBA19152.1 hypothetical protein METBIDRAFT_33359 [Metschnikowia bicuspidata var. bicuspidata NRRL YB-4993]